MLKYELAFRTHFIPIISRLPAERVTREQVRMLMDTARLKHKRPPPAQPFSGAAGFPDVDFPIKCVHRRRAMDEMMKLAAAALVVLTILCGFHVVPPDAELGAMGIVLGIALAGRHGWEATASARAALRRRWLAGQRRRLKGTRGAMRNSQAGNAKSAATGDDANSKGA